MGATFILRKSSEEQDLGFSLLEMLIALSIISLTSLALFQSIGTMLNVSDRAVQSSERALEGVILSQSVAQLVNGLVADWDVESQDSFKGQASTFSGVSASAIHSVVNENVAVSLSFEEGSNSDKVLVYETKTEKWILGTGFSPSSNFEYMGRDRVWHRQWPPVEKPTLNTQDILSQTDTLRLPQAIRVNEGADLRKYVFVVGRYQALPDRPDIPRG